MKRVLFIVAVVLFLSWGLGFFILRAGTSVHGLMIISAIFCMQGIIINPKPQVTGNRIGTK